MPVDSASSDLCSGHAVFQIRGKPFLPDRRAPIAEYQPAVCRTADSYFPVFVIQQLRQSPLFGFRIKNCNIARVTALYGKNREYQIPAVYRLIRKLPARIRPGNMQCPDRVFVQTQQGKMRQAAAAEKFDQKIFAANRDLVDRVLRVCVLIQNVQRPVPKLPVQAKGSSNIFKTRFAAKSSSVTPHSFSAL